MKYFEFPGSLFVTGLPYVRTHLKPLPEAKFWRLSPLNSVKTLTKWQRNWRHYPLLFTKQKMGKSLRILLLFFRSDSERNRSDRNGAKRNETERNAFSFWKIRNKFRNSECGTRFWAPLTEDVRPWVFRSLPFCFRSRKSKIENHDDDWRLSPLNNSVKTPTPTK